LAGKDVWQTEKKLQEVDNYGLISVRKNIDSFDKHLLIGGASPGNIINEMDQFVLGIKMVGGHEGSIKLTFIEPMFRDLLGEAVGTEQIEQDGSIAVEDLIDFEDGFGGLFGKSLVKRRFTGRGAEQFIGSTNDGCIASFTIPIHN
jgi:hypothetical protein